MGQASTAETRFNCVVPTKNICDFFLVLGNSLMNGYLSTIDDNALSTTLKNYYFPDGDQTHLRRTGGGFWAYMNKAYNYESAENHFNSVDIFGKILYHNYSWPVPMFVMQLAQNGSSLISTETAMGTWGINAVASLTNDIIDETLLMRKYLRAIGYEPRITVIWGSGGVYPGSTVAQDYTDEIEDIINEIRTVLDDNTIMFYFGKNRNFDTTTGACRDGVAAVSSNLFYTYDYNDLDRHPTNLHPTTMAEINKGEIIAGFLYEYFYGGTRPSVSNVTITGTITQGLPVGCSYTFTGSSENLTQKTDTYKLENGHGTRVEWYSAANNSGDGEVLVAITNSGTTYTINSSLAGKYLLARVFPVSNVKPTHGLPGSSSWQLIGA
jgi:hypothetical protein